MAIHVILPPRLFAAYDWTVAAGEIEMLKTLIEPELSRYCSDSYENAMDHGIKDVSESDFMELHEWLNAT